MKKFISFLLSAVCAVSMLTVNAANGDIAGKIYSTDILTYINGLPAESYNIGGKTAVILEDLSDTGYGLYCIYNEEKRLLSASFDGYKNFTPVKEEIPRGKVGKILGNIYETDIKVIFNGSEVKGYNIGGKTAVCIEDIGTVTENPNSEYGYSKYLCNFEWSEEERTVKLNGVEGYDITIVGFPSGLKTSSINLTATNNILTASYDLTNSFYTDIYSVSNSKDFESKPYVLQPLYLETNGEKYEIGLCFSTGDGITKRIVQDLETADALLKALKPEPLSKDEAFKILDDGEKYKIIDSIETEDYYFLVVKDLSVEDEWSDIYYFSVGKGGVCIRISGSSSHYTTRTLEKTDKNTVSVTVFPFAGPHGATRMCEEHNLDLYQY